MSDINDYLAKVKQPKCYICGVELRVDKIADESVIIDGIPYRDPNAELIYLCKKCNEKDSGLKKRRINNG